MEIYIIFAILLSIAVIMAKKTYRYRRYRKSQYRAETRNRLKKVEHDRGTAGEYETSLMLERVKGKKRFLFNVYIPKANGEGRTELDMVIIHEKGIFVVENKNYHGTITGKAKWEYWNHYLAGKRYTFYSPIFQNQNHLRNLEKFLERRLETKQLPPFVSAVIFNDGAKLKWAFRMRKTGAVVCNSKKAARQINRRLRRMGKVLDEREMDRIYELLKEQTRVFRWVKYGHRKRVEKIEKKFSK